MMKGYRSRILSLALTGLTLYAHAETKRDASITFSDGTTELVKVSVYPGTQFRIVTPAGEQTQNQGRSKVLTENYGKERRLELDQIKELDFCPRPDGYMNREKAGMRMEQPWHWKENENAKPGTQRFNLQEKVLTGQPYPVIEPVCNITLLSDETLEGVLQTMAIYTQAGEAYGNKKIIIRSKYTGEEGQQLDDLVYVTNIRFLDEPAKFAAETKIRFSGLPLGPADEVRAITGTSLTPVPVLRDEKDPNLFTVSQTYGEDIFLAVKRNGTLFAGWPQTNDPALFAVANDFLQRHRDFYNEKKLLGVIKVPNSRNVLMLVSLRRRIPENAFKLTAEKDPETGEFIEAFRFSVWRWRYDPAEPNMILASRGTFFRTILKLGKATPSTAIDETLWNPAKDPDGTIVIGNQKTNP